MNNEYNRIHGHWKVCDQAPNAKSSNLLVEKICELMEKGYKNKEIMLQSIDDLGIVFYKN